MHRFRTPLTHFFLIVLMAPWNLASGAEFELPMQQVGSGNFYLHGLLDGLVETDMLLDTGSGYVSLSKKTFARIESDAGTVFQKKITGIMADGHPVSVSIYRIRELSLSATCTLHNIEVAVLPGSNRDILGLSALKQLEPFVFQMTPPKLVASHCG